MASEIGGAVETIKYPDRYDRVIENGILFLLLFTPLAIGTVQAWSAAIMEITAFLIFGAWLLSFSGRDAAIVKPRFLLPLGALIALVLFQLLPLPPRALHLLSPAAAGWYAELTLPGSSAWRPLTIHPAATQDGLYKLLSYFAVFIVIINHVRRREQVKRIARAIVSVGCLLAVFAVAQKILWNGKLFWFYPLSEQLSPMGPYINRNHFAGYMEMALPLGLGLLLDQAARIKSGGTQPIAGRLNRLFFARETPEIALLSLAVLVLAAALFASLSRGAILGFSSALITFVLLARSKRSLRKRTGAIVFVVLLILLFVTLGSWDRIEDRLQALGDESHVKRIEIWQDAAGIIRDNPFWGTGLGTFAQAYLPYQSHGPRYLYDHAHNDYLEAVADLGLVGALLGAAATGLFSGALIQAWRRRHGRVVTGIGAAGFASCTALAVHSAVDFNLHIPANALLATVIAGITFSALFHVPSGGTGAGSGLHA